MAANVRYRGTYYNTTGTLYTHLIEILDTEAVAGITNVEVTQPNESFEGLTQDLKPGIYPASLTFGMYMRSSPKVKSGKTYGAIIGILDDIADSAEGRFLVRHTINGTVVFVGPMIYDQCSYTDESIPLLNVTAVDGMNRWQTTDYLTGVGSLNYYSRTQKSFTYDPTPLSYDGPLTGASYTLIEHIVNNSPAPGGVGGGVLYTATTTWVWWEIRRTESPGAGWVFQGEGLWTRQVSYDNEQETELVDSRYHLTRDIIDEKKITVLEYFTRAIAETKMTGEYVSPTVMFDTAISWREHSMTTGDPANLTRVSETQILGKSWHDVIMELCRLLNMRVYYSNGRYHFEQISLRDEDGFTRYTYESDGTLVGTETPTLDLDFSALSIQPGAGGLYKFLAPFRSVEASISLDAGNLMEGVGWNNGEQGERYLGRIKKGASVQNMYVVINSANTSTFDPSVLILFPQAFINLICLHKVHIGFSVRLKNITTNTTYWLDTVGAWDTNETERTLDILLFGGESRRYTTTDYGHTKDKMYQVSADDLPGSDGDMFDVFVVLHWWVEYVNAVGALMWTTVHTDKHWTVCNTGFNSMRFYLDSDSPNPSDWEETEVGADIVYTCENDVDNSIKVKTELLWADTSQHDKSIEIYDGTNWIQSSEWSIGGIGTAMAILELLATEIMSFRTLPRRLYSGSFLSSLPHSENRFLRGTTYYLPLSCSKNTDLDSFDGEFLEVAKTTPPAIDIISNPIAGEPLPGVGVADPPVDFDAPLFFETNEAITAASTLTEVDIVNTLGAYVAAGETVSIVHPTSGVSENVVLTQDIDPADTVMYFESNVMANSYPDASYIVLVDGGVTITGRGSKYKYDNRLYNGATHTVPVAVLDLTPLDGLSVQHINNKVKVWRNGPQLYGMDYTAAAVASPTLWWYDSGTNQITVHADFEYVDEYLGIDIDLKR